VFIGDRNLGEPPILNLSMAAGTYNAELRCPDGVNKRVQFSIMAGQTHVEAVR
jgi:hypothetical protein